MITKEGVVIISREVALFPGLSENQFTQSSVGSCATSDGSNDGFTRYFANGYWSDAQPISMHLVFSKGVIKLVSISPKWPETPTSWSDWNEENQLRIKQRNDHLLREFLGPPPYKYDWGCIESDYDLRGGFSSIVIKYHIIGED